MKIGYWLIIGTAMLGLVACGDSGGTSGGERDRLVDACLTTTNNERPMCECVADMAKEDLTSASFEMLLATFEQDDERAMELRGELSLEETVQAGMFTVNAFARCARSMSGE